MEKETEILNFVTREQNKRMINNDQSKPLMNEILGKVELQKRKENETGREIFREIEIKEEQEKSEQRKLRIEEMKKQKEQQRKIRKISFYAGLTALGIGAAISLVKYHQYENKPIRVITRELTSDAGLIQTDNGRKVSGEMTKEELASYIDEKGVSLEEINQAVDQYMKKTSLDDEIERERIENANPEIFGKSM